MEKRIIFGCDHAGFGLKEKLKHYLEGLSYQIEDVGCYDQNSIHYPLVGKKVAKKVSEGEFSQGILICGTGMGMSITANRFKNVRASLCQDPYVAKMTREHNDSNILVLGARIVGEGMAEEILKTWLDTEFEGGRHQQRIDMIEEG